MAGDTTVLAHYLAPLRAHLDRPGVTELVINRPGEFAVEGDDGWTWVEAPVLTEAWLRPLAVAAAAATSQDVSAEAPVCSTVLPTGERCQIVLPPAAEAISITLRRPSPVSFSLADFTAAGLFEAVAPGTASRDAADAELTALQSAGDWPAFFAAAVRARRNIL